MAVEPADVRSNVADKTLAFGVGGVVIGIVIGSGIFLLPNVIARRLPSPGAGDLAAFGLLTGAALGMRVFGLLLVIYAGFAIALYLPRPWLGLGRAQWRFLIDSSLRPRLR